MDGDLLGRETEGFLEGLDEVGDLDGLEVGELVEGW